jgi:hypothetical protein
MSKAVSGILTAGSRGILTAGSRGILTAGSRGMHLSRPRIPRITWCLLASFLGCGQAATCTVSGRVDLDGKPLNSGDIIFQVDGRVTRGNAIGSDGTYTVAGLPQGPALVAINVDDPPGAGPDGITTAVPGTYEPDPVLIPQRYGTLETSGLSVDIREAHQVFDIHLEKSRRPK